MKLSFTNLDFIIIIIIIAIIIIIIIINIFLFIVRCLLNMFTDLLIAFFCSICLSLNI